MPSPFRSVTRSRASMAICAIATLPMAMLLTSFTPPIAAVKAGATPMPASAALIFPVRPFQGGVAAVHNDPLSIEVRLVNAARPFDDRPAASAPFRFAGVAADRQRALDCLAAAAWYEAGDDPAGERAVVQVVLNRVRHGAYPGTVCGVVFQGSELATGCQFTFTCDGALARRPSEVAWRRARALADAALGGAVDPAVGEATHYHADYVYPYWAPSLVKLARVGAHVFYRFPGRGNRKSADQLAHAPPEAAISLLGALAQGTDAASADLAAVPTEPVASPEPLSRDYQFVRQPVAAAVPAQEVVPAGLPGKSILFAVDPAAAPGRWAIDAMSRCEGKASCRAIAWSSAGQLEANRLRPASDREGPVFLFMRRAASRTELALWDCSVVPRDNPAQCLPANPAAVRRLMQDVP
ncbi:cell wall hydrolase [Novosphingobium sp. BL-52-GroH]|uniref:cell wall hydrolase n=1 Tax=Novosphingobium sp. BL-52-GroH TaxID=3349877 RepID=UPI00384CC479